MVAVVTIYQQTRFALAQGLGGPDAKLIFGVANPCDNAFPTEVRRLPGISAVACSSVNALNTPNAKNITNVRVGGGRQVNFDLAPVDYGFFELYDVRPLAGRLFSQSYGEDGVLADINTTAQPTVIINQTGAKALGYSDPHAAIGKSLMWSRSFKPGPPPPPTPSKIVGVVPDMPITVKMATDPMFYFVFPKRLGMVSMKLTGKDVPGTIKQVERIWKQTGNTQAIQVVYLSQYRQTLYLDIIIQGVTIAICALLAVLIACLGLFALSAYTTERRTKEIGIRKVMGASTSDVVKLLVWQFTIPVLWAIAIAVPVGFWAMDNWLRHFIYHVQLSPWSFVLAAVAALVIAWATVTWQSYIVARAKPAGALRYE